LPLPTLVGKLRDNKSRGAASEVVGHNSSLTKTQTPVKQRPRPKDLLEALGPPFSA